MVFANRNNEVVSRIDRLHDSSVESMALEFRQRFWGFARTMFVARLVPVVLGLGQGQTGKKGIGTNAHTKTHTHKHAHIHTDKHTPWSHRQRQ